jgi:hypothetical protein
LSFLALKKCGEEEEEEEEEDKKEQKETRSCAGFSRSFSWRSLLGFW